MTQAQRLGAILKRERLKHGWTQEAMANHSQALQKEVGEGEQVALTQPTIQRYEAALLTTTQLEMVARICRVLGIGLTKVLSEAGYGESNGEERASPFDDVQEYLVKHPDVLAMLRSAARETQ